jgi:hypothetical protein
MLQYIKSHLPKKISLHFIGFIVSAQAAQKMKFRIRQIYAEVVTFVAGSLEAGGLPGSLEIPEVLK